MENAGELTAEKSASMIRSVRKAALNLHKLIDNLLEWSVLQQGRIPFNPGQIYLIQLLHDCIEYNSIAAKQKDIRIENTIPRDLKATVDVRMMETVFRNLISNAIKFSRHGSQVTVSATPGGNGSVEVRIRDEGVGIPAAIQSKLFRLDEKVVTPGTDGEPSTGLGLLLCKDLVEKHGGTIRIESEPGVGTTVCCTIPG